jgi:hypothetical protein
MAATDPLFSMSLPNRAPSRNNGKNCARNSAALPMKVWVQWASLLFDVQQLSSVEQGTILE